MFLLYSFEVGRKKKMTKKRKQINHLQNQQTNAFIKMPHNYVQNDKIL